jgi:hypothetical protein
LASLKASLGEAFLLNHDPADIDGDGEFDAIDIAILEEDKGVKQPQIPNAGCCLMLMVTGATFAGAVIALSHLIT